jgi:hypothetical protein
LLPATPAGGLSAVPKRPAGPGCGDEIGPAPTAGAPQPDDFSVERKPHPFELWLRRGLHQAFDAIAGEPVPEDLLRLIEEDRAEREWIRQQRRADLEPEG